MKESIIPPQIGVFPSETRELVSLYSWWLNEHEVGASFTPPQLGVLCGDCATAREPFSSARGANKGERQAASRAVFKAYPKENKVSRSAVSYTHLTLPTTPYV